MKWIVRDAFALAAFSVVAIGFAYVGFWLFTQIIAAIFAQGLYR